ncbi:MAG: methyltransferase domain-containing protein [Candidatus Paceibacterota bacterium]
MLSNNFWKKYFEVYDYLNELMPYQEVLSSIIEKLEVKSGDKIFDAGSGTGNLAHKLHQLGAEVVGLDNSEVGVQIHKKKIPEANVFIGDLTKPLPFKDLQFDKVCSNNTIYTLPKSARSFLFKELNRVLKPGGIIVVSNIKEGFNPTYIYISHINREIEINGIIKSIIKVVKMSIPTIKIFYYNYLIKKENNSGSYDFMKENEQKELLKESGFEKISDNQLVYSNQAVLNKAYKKL